MLIKKSKIDKSFVLGACLLASPAVAFAHLIAITPVSNFPATVAASSTVSAVFTVTNISAHAKLKVVDKSNFPEGLSISNTTCGVFLQPSQSCSITLTLHAKNPGSTISTALREWAQPTADGVEYPIRIKVAGSLPEITMQPLVSAGLPPLREPVVAHNNGYWLIASGTTGNFHDFDYNSFITDLYVYNPATQAVYSASVSSLPVSVKKQLLSSDPEFLQDGDTLYIIGGYYTGDNVNWTTLQTITAINVPGMITGIINAETDLSPYVRYNDSIPQFKVTGGQLGKIGNYFYLTFGQDFEGCYQGITSCLWGRSPLAVQVYTNSIYKFTTDPTLSSVTIVDVATHADGDGSGWRRRDYNLTPFMQGSTETLFAMGGPFTPGNNALVWTNGISFTSDLTANNNFINQQANQYSAALLPMYSQSMGMSYVATFSGLSNLYWSASGLVYDNTTPYGNILDLISADAQGVTQEYANLTPVCGGQPLATCLYSGLVANFVAVDQYYDARGMLQLDQLPKNTATLVGYVYGGLVSSTQDIFGFPNQSTNQVYGVYVNPDGSGRVSWQNVTNQYAGGQFRKTL